MIEERHIPSAPDYLATSDGNVISLKRGGRRVLKKTMDKDGWCRVSVMPGPQEQQHESRCKTVASLILEAFVGPKPGPEYIACHLNDDFADDRPCNLAWKKYEDLQRERVTKALRSGQFDSILAGLSDVLRRIQAEQPIEQIASECSLSPYVVEALRSAVLGWVLKRGRAGIYRRKESHVQSTPEAPDISTASAPASEHSNGVATSEMDAHADVPDVRQQDHQVTVTA